jgi:thiamine-monophosphate kinase
MARARGEFELIAALRERVAAAGAPERSRGLVLASGDDATITSRPGVTVTSVDALVEGVHFRIPEFPLASVGHKALAAALSDLAAMGAEPAEAYVQLGIPDRLDDDLLLELADGLGRVAAEHRVAVAGGDVTAAPALFVAVTAVGHAADEGALSRRSGARPGDVLVVTGALGGAAAGLLLLERQDLDRGLDETIVAELRRRQLEPEPRLAAGAALAGAGASAMIDISDGLGGDVQHLANASSIRARIELASVPVAEGVAEVGRAAGREPLDLATTGGEDYELLAAIPDDRLAGARAAIAATGLSLTTIGAVEAGSGAIMSGPDGTIEAAPGFDQRRSAGRRR